ncbi:MAG: LysM domain-containing protein [Chloroflexi bacterium]|nr:LysM domain-containing protein [Chloroflexota bacterium]
MPHKRFALILPLLLVFALRSADAQEAVCKEIVAGALLDLSERCADLDRNSLCYGHSQVDASFAGDSTSADFDTPGARASLAQLTRLQTSALDVERGHWGLAIMNLQANLPQSRPGSGVIMLLAGDATLDHEVDLSEIDEIREPLSTVALESTTRFSQAAKIAEELGQLQKDEIALVDARTSAGEWLRLVNAGAISWVERDHLAPLQGMASLPVVDAADPFALQALSFSSAREITDCDAAQPMLAIQTPDRSGVNLTVNDVDIHLQSLVSFQQVHRNALSMTVHRGAATTAFGNTVLAGNTVVGILASTGSGKTAILDWSGALPVSDAELARGQRLQEALNGLARANGWAEHATEMSVGDLIHVVAGGDTLFALARRYDVSVADIVAVNDGLSPSRLSVGTELLIPNPGSGFGGLGSAKPEEPSAPIAAAPKTAPPDCSGLRLTSPLETAPGGISPYYWDGIAAATGYQVKVYDHGTGSLVGSFQTSADQTSISFSAGQLGVGGALQWEVIALAEGRPICSTGESAPLPHR